MKTDPKMKMCDWTRLVRERLHKDGDGHLGGFLNTPNVAAHIQNISRSTQGKSHDDEGPIAGIVITHLLVLSGRDLCVLYEEMMSETYTSRVKTNHERFLAILIPPDGPTFNAALLHDDMRQEAAT